MQIHRAQPDEFKLVEGSYRAQAARSLPSRLNFASTINTANEWASNIINLYLSALNLVNNIIIAYY